MISRLVHPLTVRNESVLSFKAPMTKETSLSYLTTPTTKVFLQQLQTPKWYWPFISGVKSEPLSHKRKDIQSSPSEPKRLCLDTAVAVADTRNAVDKNSSAVTLPASLPTKPKYTIGDFLKRHNLQEYEENFLKAGYNCFDRLLAMDLAQLEALSKPVGFLGLTHFGFSTLCFSTKERRIQYCQSKWSMILCCNLNGLPLDLSIYLQWQ